MIDPKLRLKQLVTLVILVVVLLLACAWSMTSGDYKMSVGTFFKTLFGFGDYTDSLVLLQFRMPRMLITILAGAALALSGALLQSVTRNPLAEPGILGVNAGSGFCIALFIGIGHVSADNFVYVLPLISMVGGLLTSFVIFSFSYNRGKGITPASMVLVGVGMASALSGGALTVMATFDKDQSEFIASWLAGNIWGDEWPFVISFIPWLIVLIPYVFAKSNVLNLLNTHPDIAQGMGVKVSRERFIILFVAVLLSSAAVSVAGAIGFIGLMGPHIAKTIVGPRHQLFMPLSVLIGACLLVIADTIGQTIIQPTGVPAGIVVAIIGAPYFLYLMYRTKSV
ncbi:FecCD family ABC transporter permease [Staphylococcus pettenkoferi]|uniref:Probable heme-iron transport system permease protein IsdF n=1 Tax=Staphylococcus pettenkoferi TaxID=170573 RepID=A0A9Q4D5Z1_9STAP|nr:iron ABC transporter permease [Staphylococcus pettenkoferi]MCY1568993.1 iron ABC transporter permease [Staphylococcus pettenkoferi]MCY1576890.1 iron ABC transporter permease [Staphylococcus pettenkoferi]MCY1594574.1 iron ABC transporter permease [Staphylococcus pettenkoferi]MCY1618897.1 iron ABC transporter permease [Staphylococcus pettenkoferi]